MQHMTELPRLAEADGVFFFTLATSDRPIVVATLGRLIDMLEVLTPEGV